MEPVRVGIVGCGKVAGLHAAALRAVPEAVYVGACDADFGRSSAFAAKHGGTAFADLESLLHAVEVVLIATPHPAHAAPAVRAAEAGVHVLVEKPMAATLADCDAMIAAAKRTGVHLGVISQRRFYEPVQRIKAAIDAGKLGTPALGLFLMYSWRDAAYYTSDPWRGRWDTEGGGVLVNQSPHQLDLLLWLLGPAAEVTGFWANLNHPTVEVDDTAVAAIRFRNGALGSILTSVAQKPGIHTKVHVHGSNGASVGVETDTGASFVAGVSGSPRPSFGDRLFGANGGAEQRIETQSGAQIRGPQGSCVQVTHNTWAQMNPMDPNARALPSKVHDCSKLAPGSARHARPK